MGLAFSKIAVFVFALATTAVAIWLMVEYNKEPKSTNTKNLVLANLILVILTFLFAFILLFSRCGPCPLIVA